MKRIIFLVIKHLFRLDPNRMRVICDWFIDQVRSEKDAEPAKKKSSAQYWSEHLVPHEDWPDASESLNYFSWRNLQYPGYIELMPVCDADNLTVMDYGCGPGNDLVGFHEFSNPIHLIGLDVSNKALAVAHRRALLHGLDVSLIRLEEELNQIPIASNSVDLVHSSGVLHHVKNLPAVLAEIKRVMKCGARLQIMVYNYQSIWLHLYTSYVHQIEMGLYKHIPLLEAFRRTTDGPECPISKCYRPAEFLELMVSMGFEGRFKGAAVSLLELELMSKRFQAIKSRQLAKEHREFLSSLTFNEKGYPMIEGHVAGIAGCYEFRKAPPETSNGKTLLGSDS